MNDADWDRLIRQLRRGDCTPLLGAGSCFGRLPTGAELSRHFAHEYKYPFADADNLARVMQYAALVGQDPVELKHEVCTYLKQYRAGRTQNRLDPHMVLAEFPIPTFVTTNYDDFMVQALQRCRAERKSPEACTSTWWDTEADEVPLLEPTQDRPLVYHLHGQWDDPASLVLTEDDYLTYLVNMVDARASGVRQPLPTPVLAAMTASPLLFVGYSLQDWNFRVLFHGLIRPIPQNRRRRHVSVQLLPELSETVAGAAQKAEEYLERYLDGWHISIYIGSTEDFFEELLDRLRTA
ncbi:SIR2 family NAD-dependent protein deacylase [Microbispora hainanensis]|uniref:SIR2 family protein n=1 Tax=Microbispora hainanensis TaxID=568844 RepID=A0A544YMM8_9ACTN|nr:SIR2 family protein [Microbispora hainanensis]TQS17822.1 SIR2 family protein [Microbispora hainanensis]